MVSASLFAEHLQHALRDGEAAEHVDRHQRDAHDCQADDPVKDFLPGLTSQRTRQISHIALECLVRPVGGAISS